MFHRILIANDGSDGALRALDAALDLATAVGCAVHMISVEEDLPKHAEAESLDEIREEKNREDTYFGKLGQHAIQRAALKGVTLEHTIVSGHEVKSVVEFARSGRFDLLVVGYVGHSKLYDHLWGGTSQNLTRLSPCSVLVVK
ncbi:MAG TPA: universal stress protein [Bryobacteraceae bacterium]|nr:universal stress protein [Bryobacteraceae bacterium]